MIKFLSLLVSFLFIVERVDGATFHAILVADTALEGLMSPTMENNIDLMHRFAKRAAAYSDMELEVAVFEGYYAYKKNIYTYLDALHIEKDDVIFLYCFAHGSRDDAKANKWPDLNIFMESVDFGDLTEVLKAKSPRFLLAFAEACNVVREDSDTIFDQASFAQFRELLAQPGPAVYYTMPELPVHLTMSIDDEELEICHLLFLETSGDIVISSSIPGQASYRDFVGGRFGRSFINSFNFYMVVANWLVYDELFQKVKSLEEVVSWPLILDHACQLLSKELEADGKGYVQTPQYEINLHE